MSTNDDKKNDNIEIQNNEEKIFGFNEKTNSWHCTVCGTDMGIHNPRQLCGKTKCYKDIDR